MATFDFHLKDPIFEQNFEFVSTFKKFIRKLIKRLVPSSIDLNFSTFKNFGAAWKSCFRLALGKIEFCIPGVKGAWIFVVWWQNHYQD